MPRFRNNLPYSWAHKILSTGDRSMKVTEQLDEVLDGKTGQRHVMVQATDLLTHRPLLVKIQYYLYPRALFAIKEPESLKAAQIDNQHFLHKTDAHRILSAFNHGPRYIDHFIQRQLPGMPLPGWPISFIIMGDIPGDNLADIRSQLSDDELESVNKQIAQILRCLRMHKYKLLDHQLRHFRYNRDKNKVCLVDLIALGYLDEDEYPCMPITVSSPCMEAFGLQPMPQSAVPSKPPEPEWDWEEIGSGDYPCNSTD